MGQDPAGAPPALDGAARCRPPAVPDLAEAAALLGGWAVAVAALLPPVLAADAGRRAAAWLSLGAALAFWAVAVAIVRSDIADFVIPDELSLALAILGLSTAAGVPVLSGEGLAEGGTACLAAAATGAGAFALFWAVGAGFRAMGRDALGHGDVKLAGACAISLPPADGALALEVAALGAMAVLLLSRRAGPLRDTAVPFGAFMAPAAWLVLVLAPPLRDAGMLPW